MFCIHRSTIFTGRNEVVARVIFLHLSVILFTGGSASVHAGIPPQTRQTPPRPGRPPRSGRSPGPGRHPPDQADTPQTRQTPQDQADPRDQADPPGPGGPPRPGRPPLDQADPPPPGSRLQHTVYERPVRILLECILVNHMSIKVIRSRPLSNEQTNEFLHM